MASILDKYGIKEVADVTFYEITSTGTVGKPVLYLDTLKVSTIEQTAEQADARGGKGNPKLITWDYSKEITVTLEDALFSAKSMAVMFGTGSIDDDEIDTMRKTLTVTCQATLASGVSVTSKLFTAFKEIGGSDPAPTYKPDGNDNTIKILPSQTKVYDETGAEVTSVTAGEKYFLTFNFGIKGSEIDVSANSFPGTYYITGDTYARSALTGGDEFFQFIIPKAKVTSENTITLEAEGDPSTFSMNLTVLRPESGPMMKLVKYTLDDSATTDDPAGTVIDGDPI